MAGRDRNPSRPFLAKFVVSFFLLLRLIWQGERSTPYMSSAAVAQLRFINAIPIEAVTHTDGCQTAGHLYPELAGYKVRMTGQTPIYVIDRYGYRRLVPFPHTFMHLFKDSAASQGMLVSDKIGRAHV